MMIFRNSKDLIFGILLIFLLIYVIFIFTAMIVLIILLWIFSLMMYKILSKASLTDDKVKMALYFSKLRFTRLTMVSSVAFLFAIFFLLIWVFNYISTGMLSWYVYVIIPIFWNLSP